MKIKYFRTVEPDVECIIDLDETYKHIQELDKIFGTNTSLEDHHKKGIQLCEVMKEKGQITSYEII